MKSIMQWLKEIRQGIREENDQAFKDELFKKEEIITQWIIQHESDVDYIKAKKKKILELETEVLDLKHDLNEVQKKLEQAMLKEQAKEDELEEYWNNKITPMNLQYKARGTPMDVRKFLTTNNDKVPSYASGTNDKKAEYCLKYVINKITYTSDKELHDMSEFWQYANETLALKKGDCEDGAILMANMMVASGIPYWRVRLNAGDVKGGGHAYVTYLRESDNKWYVLDWCYWPRESLDFGQLWSEAKNYFGIWFSWNTKYIFAKDTLDRD